MQLASRQQLDLSFKATSGLSQVLPSYSAKSTNLFRKTCGVDCTAANVSTGQAGIQQQAGCGKKARYS